MNPIEPLLGAVLIDDLVNNRAATPDRPTADNTLLRGSDAYRCARQIGFGATRTPRVVPFPTDTLMAFDAGQHHHIRLQGLLASKFGAELEVPVSYREVGVDVSGHADAVYPGDSGKVTVEVKSMKGYPFVRSAGGTDKYGRHVEPEGPKLDHLVQAGIYAESPQIGGDTIHIVYINKEDGRVAEWLVNLDDEIGADNETLHELVVEELVRLSEIGADIKAGYLPWRSIPGHGVVKDPMAAKGDDGFFWGCNYCGWQPLCADLPASKVSIDLIGRASANGALSEDEPF